MSHSATGATPPILVCWTSTIAIVPISRHAPQVSCVSAPAASRRARPGGRGVGGGPGSDSGTSSRVLRDVAGSGTPTHDAVMRRGRLGRLTTVAAEEAPEVPEAPEAGDAGEREPPTSIHTFEPTHWMP